MSARLITLMKVQIVMILEFCWQLWMLHLH